MADSKSIVTQYFEATDRPFFYKCKACNTIRKKSGSGWGNLMPHVHDKHPEFKETVASARAGNIIAFNIVNKDAVNMHQWLEWIVDRNLPLSEVNNILTKKMSKLSPVSSKTLKQVILHVTKRIESSISMKLPPKFGLVFDGWSDTSTGSHFVAVFASYAADGLVKNPLLGFSVLEGESDFGAAAHEAYFSTLLHMFGRKLEDVLFLCADNASTNSCLANRMKVPHIGCASHRLNLAVKSFLDLHSELILKVHQLMLQLGSLIFFGGYAN